MGGAIEGVVTHGGIAVAPPTWCHVVARGLSGRGGLSALGAAAAPRGVAMADGDGARRGGGREIGVGREGADGSCVRLAAAWRSVGGCPAAGLAWKAPYRTSGPLNASLS